MLPRPPRPQPRYQEEEGSSIDDGEVGNIETSGSRKGRSNAILTYEVVSGLDSKLTRLVAQFEYFSEAMRKRDQEALDFEARLRGLESRMTVTETASGTSKGTWNTVWFGVIAVGTLLLSLTNTIVQLLHASSPPPHP